tara:strand:+ start:411 stop:668 length:258 start_codon:yes stop_codon:yes gene_type:complete
MTVSVLPSTPAEANALYKKAGKVLGTPKKNKRIGVVGITKAENAQLGLLLKYIFTNDEVYNALPKDVLVYPDAFTALCARYSNAV